MAGGLAYPLYFGRIRHRAPRLELARIAANAVEGLMRCGKKNQQIDFTDEETEKEKMT